ncbi:hypothetical protein KM043_006571 [Ampulex compressa]|nr:hypothetical protein KM043_006571 [Ampulex compressa]
MLEHCLFANFESRLHGELEDSRLQWRMTEMKRVTNEFQSSPRKTELDGGNALKYCLENWFYAFHDPNVVGAISGLESERGKSACARHNAA